MKQVVNPTPDVPCKPGWCLAYAEDVFRTPHLYADATTAWMETRYKHYDRPSGISVPVYFSMQDVPEGHTAVYMSDGSVYSTTSATSTKPTHHRSLDDLIAVYKQYHPTFKYLGWSEDLAGVRIVGDEMVTKQDLDAIYKYGPLWRTRAKGEGENVYLNKPTAFVMTDHFNSKEYKDKLAREKAATTAKDKQIKDLQKEVVTLKAAPVPQSSDAAAKDTNDKVNWLVGTIKKIFNIGG